MQLKNKIYPNHLFWVCYFFYEWLTNAALNNEYEKYLLFAALLTPLTFVASWFTIDVLIRNYFLRNKKVGFWTILGVSMVLFALVRRAINYYVLYPTIANGVWSEVPYFFIPKIIFEIVNIYLIVGLNAMFYFLQAWYEQQRLTNISEQDKVKAQLELLKSQVQPHFIFNTLNNIYAFSINNNPNTSDLIFRLSSLLSYMLYDSKKDMIPLTKELEYIKNYVELEKIRYTNKLDVSINVFDNIDHFTISPLLLLPLIENCFKHGICDSIESGWIRVDVSLNREWLIIKIENSKEKEQKNHNGNNGIGLVNVQKRLEILYKNDYDLKLLSEEASYLVVLKIKNFKHENSMPDS